MLSEHSHQFGFSETTFRKPNGIRASYVIARSIKEENLFKIIDLQKIVVLSCPVSLRSTSEIRNQVEVLFR